MRGSDSLWRPLERIDTLVVGTRGVQLVRVVAWWTSCRPTSTSITVRSLFGGRWDIVGSDPLRRALGLPADAVADHGLAWYDRDGDRGVRCSALGVSLSVRAPRHSGPRSVAEVSRLLRRVTVAATPTAAPPAAEGPDEGLVVLRPGTHPGLYTRWPIIADSERETVLNTSPARIATGPAALFRPHCSGPRTIAHWSADGRAASVRSRVGTPAMTNRIR